MNSGDELAHNLFQEREPTDVVFDTLWVTHSEFWLVLAAAGHFVDVSTAIPSEDSIVGNGDAVGIPTRESVVDVRISLSVWPTTPPDGRGAPLGSTSIEVEGRELRLVNVEGREPGPVLLLEEDGPHLVRVWRSEPGPEGQKEFYDIRVWRDATSR
ncbi:hypothetical protein ABZ615_12050 [Streptomyces sp. NPDC007325]|uniref:hypothetical protein n=1 Tax=Streptomyces sp. NPDC007325 TaxID=3154588 RepID=UPI0033D88D1D